MRRAGCCGERNLFTHRRAFVADTRRATAAAAGRPLSGFARYPAAWVLSNKTIAGEERMRPFATRNAAARAACAGAMAFFFSSGAAAQGTVNALCSTDAGWCEAAAAAFTRETGIKVQQAHKGTGEIGAQLRAEAANPKTDIWWGGTGDPFLQAAEQGLLEPYRPAYINDLHDWAVRQYAMSQNMVGGFYTSAIGFGFNTDLLKKKKLNEPKCWADLVKPEFKGHVQIANPNSSGTAYTMLATIVQLMGEEEGFEYMKALHANVNQYTKSGSAPIKAAGLGETTVGIVFLHDAVAQVAAGFPVVPVAPCEGTGYEIGSMSIIAGARNEEDAQRFYDWALTAEVQSRAQTVNSFQLPSNKAATQSRLAPDLSEIKLIDYDFAKYGSSEERRRLLKKWDDEVASLPQ
jgi:iron(III) transport system substrate-binding protein